MAKRILTWLVVGWATANALGEEQPIELLLPGGALYSVSSRSYRSLCLPDGWTVEAGGYSPDVQSIAWVLVGHPAVSKKVPKDSLFKGPVNKTIRSWDPSTRLILLDRHTGLIRGSWRLPERPNPLKWLISWKSATLPTATGHSAGTSDAAAAQTACPRLLADIRFQEKEERFTLQSAACFTPPEISDAYRLVRENGNAQKEAILWEYHVPVDTASCSEPYACYSGKDVQFFAVGEKLFLAWDGDLYTLDETEEGVKAELTTQLLPQYSHPWGMAIGSTKLNDRDVASKVNFQPASSQLSIPLSDNPLLYAQNFCPTRSFNAAVDVGPYHKNLMIPGGYQVGPVEIGSFKEHAYTPLLVSVTWTAFHHIAEPISCASPDTVLPNTRGVIVSITQDNSGALKCHIDFQEDR